MTLRKLLHMKLMSMKKNCESRKKSFQVLCSLPGLTPKQVVKATRLIGQEAAKLDLFLSMLDDYKVIFARQEIDDSN